MAFSAGQLTDLRATTRAAAGFALELSTQQGVSAVTRSYDAFCAACGICPVQFTMHIIMDWMTDYCRQGFTARSLSSRLSSLRRYARRLRMPFPALDSYEWADINDLRTALLKIDPTCRNLS